MYYAGVDAHRSYLTVAIVDEGGELVHERKRVPTGDGEPLLEALEGYRPLKAVVETCPFWPWIHDTLEPTKVGFHLAHASGLEAIAGAEVKTDQIDARLLARMLSVALVPEAYPKPEAQRDLARRVRHRKRLVPERTPAPAGTKSPSSETPEISRGEFSSNVMVQVAVTRRIEIIGEAVKKIPDEVRRPDPGVP